MQSDATPTHSAEADGSQAECNRRVLLIDDNHAIHDDYNKILRPPRDNGELDELGSLLFDGESPAPVKTGIGFETSSAYQGQEALSLVERAEAEGRPFAMAFVDMRMPPGWDGLETIKRLWEVSPDLQVVICSAYSDHSWDELVNELPKEDQWLLLRKPFDGAEVSQLALALTRKWNLGRETDQAMQELRKAVAERGELLRALGVSTDRMYSECGKIADHVEKSFNAVETLLSACNELEHSAACEGAGDGTWAEAAAKLHAASPEGELSDALQMTRQTLESFRQIRETVANMREMAGLAEAR